jgi:hypothetical protein
MTAERRDVAAALALLPRTTGEASWRVVHDHVSDVLASACGDSSDASTSERAVTASLDGLADTVSQFRKALIGDADHDGDPGPTDRFALDPERAGQWVAAKLDELGVVGKANATFLELGGEDFHESLEQYLHELVEFGALSEPPGWSIGLYALDDTDQWGYLATVRVSNNAMRPGGAPFFQVAATSEDVSIREPVLDEVGCVVRTANRLLPIARAALACASPDGRHHADGMCKAHGDYDCGEDQCG